MKKILTLLLLFLLLISCAPKSSFDGKDRPSVNGQLQVLNGKLCDKDGKEVMLRGISSNGLSVGERYINEDTFQDISHTMKANLFRLALYTWGVGSVGYCSGGDKNRLYQTVVKGVEAAEKADLYAIVDWHILDDGDPNKYLEESKDFFDRISNDLKDKDNVLYEICNEPNHCDWEAIKNYAEVIIPIIRKNDPDSVIIVGTPNWSQDVDTAAEDPLDFENILYTLHFYSSTHKEELRDRLKTALSKGLPVFVTEFGITSSSGGYPLNKEEADIWIDLLEENKISWCMWNFSKAAEPCAALKGDCLKTKDFSMEDFSEAGLWFIDTVEKNK